MWGVVEELKRTDIEGDYGGRGGRLWGGGGGALDECRE
ncbi:hypothetical protein PC121_g18247 [Phytophthora cactorum]|nr:hypothetical protein PC121_g18247 [Phytophthora cactorum]